MRIHSSNRPKLQTGRIEGGGGEEKERTQAQVLSSTRLGSGEWSFSTSMPQGNSRSGVRTGNKIRPRFCRGSKQACIKHRVIGLAITVYIYTINDCIYGDFPAKNTVSTLYIFHTYMYSPPPPPPPEK
jgi:hypothetical protein